MKRTEFTQPWLDALRSGKYVQAKCTLNNGFGYCAFGVAGSVLGVDMTDHEYAYDEIFNKIGVVIGEGDISKIMTMNDGGNKTFPEIADEIDRMLEPE